MLFLYAPLIKTVNYITSGHVTQGAELYEQIRGCGICWALSDKVPTAPLPCSVFGKEAALGRNVKMFLCRRYTDEKLKDIGAYFGIGESGVSQACRCVKDKIRKDKKPERKISKIEKKIKV